jgi:hypothetical protein
VPAPVVGPLSGGVVTAEQDPMMPGVVSFGFDRTASLRIVAFAFGAVTGGKVLPVEGG